MPTPKQAAVLEAAQEAGLNRSIQRICAAANVDRRGFYRWLEKDPDFRAAWEDIWRGTIKRHMPGVVAAQFAKALAGDTPAARLVADLAGLMKQHVEADIRTEAAVDIPGVNDLLATLGFGPVGSTDPRDLDEGAPGSGAPDAVDI
jgi:hypothetical protein